MPARENKGNLFIKTSTPSECGGVERPTTARRHGGQRETKHNNNLTRSHMGYSLWQHIYKKPHGLRFTNTNDRTEISFVMHAF